MAHVHSNKQSVQAIQLSILTASTLAIIKIAAGLFTHSMAVMASALDSLMDIASSVVNLVAIREASKPPDREHTYGHEKIESLAGLFQSLAVSASGIYLVVEAIRRLFTGTFVQVIPVGIAVMLISIVLTGLLTLRLTRIAKESKSLIVATEKLHYTTDIFSNLGIILALVLVRLTGVAIWDLIVSLAVSAYILKSAFKILKHAIDELLDKSLPMHSVAKIQSDILDFHPSIVGVHNFRSHKVGRKVFLDFHIEIRGEDDFKTAHLMTESMIENIRKEYPEADVTVHFDPEGED